MHKTRNFVLSLILVIAIFLAAAAESSMDVVFAETIASSTKEGAGTRDMGAGTATGTGASGQGHGDSELAAGSI